MPKAGVKEFLSRPCPPYREGTTPSSTLLVRCISETVHLLRKRLQSTFFLNLHLPTAEELQYPYTKADPAWAAHNAKQFSSAPGWLIDACYTEHYHPQPQWQRIVEAVDSFQLAPPTSEQVLDALSLLDLMQLWAMTDYGPSDCFLEADSDTEDEEMNDLGGSAPYPVLLEYSLEHQPLVENSFDAAVMRGVDLFVKEVEYTYQQMYATTAIVSISTLLRLRDSPHPHRLDLLNSPVGQQYLRFHPDILDLCQSFS